MVILKFSRILEIWNFVYSLFLVRAFYYLTVPHSDSHCLLGKFGGLLRWCEWVSSSLKTDISNLVETYRARSGECWKAIKNSSKYPIGCKKPVPRTELHRKASLDKNWDCARQAYRITTYILKVFRQSFAWKIKQLLRLEASMYIKLLSLDDLQSWWPEMAALVVVKILSMR